MRAIVIIYLFLTFNKITYSQNSETFSYFDDFTEKNFVYNEYDTDSIAISTKIVDRKLIYGFQCYNFEVQHNKEKVNFWIGVKDSVLYSFKKNNLKKPVILFDPNKPKKEDTRFFYTSSSKYKVEVREFFFSSGNSYGYGLGNNDRAIYVNTKYGENNKF